MIKDFEAVVGFAKRALNAEMTTDPGRLNMATILGSLLLIAGGSLLDAWQALVRTVRPEYESGMPSIDFLLALFLIGGLICVAIVGYFSSKQDGEA